VTLFYPVPLALRPRFFLGTQLLKEDPNVVDEEVGRCLAGKVVASVVEIPGDDVFAVAFRKESDRLGDVVRGRVLLGRFWDLTTIRDAWCSDLALGATS
jgi:hypothetical protein